MTSEDAGRIRTESVPGSSTAPGSRGGVAYAVLRAVGSLWYAALLLVLALVAMACATIFESSRGTEAALKVFYGSRWFVGLLALVAVNVAAAMIIRFPFHRRQIGFVITHGSILVTLAGAFVTSQWGVDGQVGIAEGETVSRFSLPKGTLTVLNRADGTRAEIDLTSRDFDSFTAVERPRAGILTLGNLEVGVERYLPDSEVVEQMMNDNSQASYAVEVSLSMMGRDQPRWLRAGEPARFGSRDIIFRVVDDGEEMARLLAPEPADTDGSDGVVQIEYEGLTYELPLSRCREEPVPVGETGYTARVLRYLPHASVGPDNKLVNVSDRPMNPAIEVELAGPDGKETRLAFARFPDFASMHGGQRIEELKVEFSAPDAAARPSAAIEVLQGSTGKLYVRFPGDAGGADVQEVALGVPVESPWPTHEFKVLRQFDHARLDRSVVAVEPREEARIPAVLLNVSTAEGTTQSWLQKFRPRRVTMGGVAYEFIYGNKALPLGFSLKLDRFHLGFYPGGSRPRSFESHVTIVDPSSGGTESRVISMNNPTKYGGYTLFQSSYRLEGSRAVSFLSVARDRGMPIVFAGYIGMMGGMLVVLGTRIWEHRKSMRAGAVELPAERSPPLGNPPGQDVGEGNEGRVDARAVEAVRPTTAASTAESSNS